MLLWLQEAGWSWESPAVLVGASGQRYVLTESPPQAVAEGFTRDLSRHFLNKYLRKVASEVGFDSPIVGEGFWPPVVVRTAKKLD
eukprot:8319617-Pyramimonas_sp.AAC.1